MRHSWATDGSQVFYSLFYSMPQKFHKISKISKINFCQFCIIFCTVPTTSISMEYFEAHIFTVSTMRVIGSLVFLILPWFLLYFLYVLNETLSLLESLYLCIIASFNDGSSPLPLKIFPFLFSDQKSKNLVCSAS